jgi:tRNA nucleotidyltransferase (CCA-adding enzyme)
MKKIYLVGGAVRDMLLGLEPKDSDFVVVGSTPQEMLDDGLGQVGADFPVFLHPVTGDEYALARIERKTSAGYAGFEVNFDSTVTLEQDLGRRDLTINSMAIDQETGLVIDPYGGREDLEKKLIRHTSDAFAEDPVRVLRAARFAARYTEFTIHEDTTELMAKIVTGGEFDALTPERVWAEFEKGLMEEMPSRMFMVLSSVMAYTRLKEFFFLSAGRMQSLDDAASDHADIEVRFAIMASNFMGPADFRKWRIPSACEEVASLLNNNLMSLYKYEELTFDEKVQLFNRMDLRRRQERFEKVLAAATFISRYTQCRNKQSISNEIKKDVVAFMRVDGGRIAAAQTDKMKIKDAIFAAHVDALKTRDWG